MAYRACRSAVRPPTWEHDFRTLYCRRYGLSEAEAGRYLWKNVLVHYLGGNLPDPIEVPSIDPAPGDRLILATDGVHKLVEPADLLAACGSTPARRRVPSTSSIWRSTGARGTTRPAW